MTLASTLTRCEPRRRPWRLTTWLMRVVMMLLLSAMAAGVIHVGGHIHRACLRYQAEILEVAK